MMINCLVIDDEPTSQNILKRFIAKIDYLNLCGTFNNAIEAQNELKNNKTIELLFLDINMPIISGITFYKSLQNPPNVIFTTAYPQYAVDGFEVNAVDFLLKPISFERFYKAINKVLDKKSILETVNKDDSFILIKSNKILHKIYTNDILYIEAFGDYVKVYLDNNYLLTNNTFTKVLELLPKNKFVRSHKSFAINLNKINTLKGNQVSINNHVIPIGQKYKSDFLRLLKS